MLKNLSDLFVQHIQNLYAAETRLVEEMPAIVEKAQHRSLKNALEHHLNITKEQKERLESIVELLNEDRLDAVLLDPQYECKGIEALLQEMKDVLEKGLEKDVIDAAIIAYVQKIEHYEISTYGSAVAYATQLRLTKAQEMLQEALDEEYDADDLLTALATASLNKEAVTEDLKHAENTSAGTDESEADAGVAGQVHITERTINSPGGRAGTSHRRYGTGESRGH